MFIVFMTKITSTSTTADHYRIVDDQEEAEAIFAKWSVETNTYCAGWAKTSGATEPHWMD